MLYIRLLVVGCVAVFSLVFFFSQGDLSKGANYLNFFKIASSVEEASVGNCVPESIGNQYFRINKPDGFCSCIMEGKKKQDDIIAGGSTLDEYKKMCVEVFYKDASLRECSKINAMLAKHKKKGRVDCECFSMIVKSTVVNLASFDKVYADKGKATSPSGIGKEDALTKGYKEATKMKGFSLKNSKNKQKNTLPDVDYVVQDTWVHRCIR